MADIVEERLPLKCCGCGAISPDGVKPCDCATMCGYREGDRGSVWFMSVEQAEQAKMPALIESLRSRAENAEAENAELKQAIDSIEIADGLTDNGNLWRFWSSKEASINF